MKAKIKNHLRKQFVPFFSTVIMGQPTKVSLKDAEDHPDKYINTPIGPLYEDHKALEAYLKKRVKKDDPIVLDMRQGERGFVFDKNHKSKKDESIEKLLAKSKKTRAKIKARYQAQLKAKEDQKDAQDKAVKAAVAKAKKASAKKELAKETEKK